MEINGENRYLFFSVSFRISYFDDFWEINLRVCVLIGGGGLSSRETYKRYRLERINVFFSEIFQLVNFRSMFIFFSRKNATRFCLRFFFSYPNRFCFFFLFGEFKFLDVVIGNL